MLSCPCIWVGGQLAFLTHTPPIWFVKLFGLFRVSDLPFEVLHQEFENIPFCSFEAIGLFWDQRYNQLTYEHTNLTHRACTRLFDLMPVKTNPNVRPFKSPKNLGFSLPLTNFFTVFEFFAWR